MEKKYFYILSILLLFSFNAIVYGQVTDPTNVSKPAESIEGLQLYPNPTSTGKVYITSNNNLPKEIGLYDILGKKIFSSVLTTRELNLPNINPGVYIIKIKEKDATATRKLVIR
ncbi:T9SS type A sorting domain-containing protein [Flavobacterium sp. NKUCC04_CG]|uniref:T9SS type A sorting domain-containing protein n=1 Tax=Flavobacterium sp. NKUCC04_CG TaxID=2842121 RepID=UPI001C5BF3C3|nr:T9SS type A sorting domain-containing protein [Flavobacterium sp. NKUCC04_CG]MBW3518930.1 T9SS type A sorting domain-containing protein [Flavobacterium sp. NKUCC04_CG]